MKFIFSLLACAFIFSTTTFAQKTKPVNSGALISEGVELHNQEKYKEAIEKYKQVPVNDTNYVRAQYELALSQSVSGELAEAIATCNRALARDFDDGYKMDLLGLMASTYDDQKNYTRAIKLYDSALAIYPNSPNLLINKGICLNRQDKVDEAEAIFKNLLIKNPLYASAHFRLGQCALKKGLMVQAIMCFYAYLLDYPEGPQANNIIKTLDAIGKGTDDVIAVVNKRTAEQTGNFALVEQILLSKIALDKNYKVLTSLDDPIIRQLQVMMEKLEYDPESNDFYMQFYVPLLKDIYKNNLFEPAVYEAFSNVNIESIQKYLKKESKEVTRAVGFVANYFNQIRFTRELNYEKRQQAAVVYHFDNNVLFGKGKFEDKKLIGHWEFYHKNGNLKSVGDYNNDGKKIGKWTYYFDNGVLNGIDNWNNGQQEGEDITYNHNGVITAKSIYKNGEQEQKLTYYSIGHLYSSTTFKNGKEEGKYIQYHSNGAKKIEAETADDELSGKYLSFYNNGKPEIVATYVKSKLDGNYKSYYDNGELESEANYVKGDVEGLVTNYHRNKQIKSKANYVKGALEGEELTYNELGVLSQKLLFKKGKLDGNQEYYDEDGKPYSILIFDNDKFKGAKYFDRNGQEISTSTRQNKQIELTVYNMDRKKASTVTYNDNGEKLGREIYYYNNGAVKETNNYIKGSLAGVSTGYYPNGKIKYETSFENGEKNGPAKNYFLNGKLSSEGWYSGDKLNGDWYEYNEKGKVTSITTYLNDDAVGIKHNFHEDGRPDDDEIYQNGWFFGTVQYDSTGKVLHSNRLVNSNGPYKGLHENGKLRYEGKYENGSVQGPLTIYFFDGTVNTKKSYEKGMLNGDFTVYFYGGKVMQEGKYDMGKKTGLWKYYAEDGRLERTENFVNGSLSGLVTYYDAHGKLDREIMYRDGERNGLHKRYAPDGQLACVLNYRDNVIIGYAYNGKDNKLVPFVPIDAGNGTVKAYYANGKPSVELTIEEGELTGPYSVYFPDGKPMYMETNLENGTTNGQISEYWENGNKKTVYTYVYDKPEGVYKEYYENGKLKEEGNYYNGALYGEQKRYDETGKLKETRIYYFDLLVKIIK